MNQLAILEAQFAQNLTREDLACIDVMSRRLSEARPARWVGAPVDVLTALPAVPYKRVATLWVPGSGTFATAVVYEQCPASTPLAGNPAPQLAGVQLLIKRARALGADAIVLHDVFSELRRREAA